MRRIRAVFASESPARSAGLYIKRAQDEGFTCPCGKHIAFSKYVLAHWVESLQHRCPTCSRVFKFRAGEVTEISGPVKRVSRIKGASSLERMDPRTPLWRTYQALHSAGRPVAYQPTGDYSPTLDTANATAWDYANKCEPLHRQKREDLFGCLLRREEYPLLSTIETDGMIVGSGDLLMIGIRKDELRQTSVYEFELRDPKGRVSRVTLTPEVFAEIMAAFEHKPMTTAEALKPPQKKKGKAA